MLSMFVRGAFRLTDRDAMRLAAIGSAICIANFVALVTVGINITLFWILLGPIIRACDLYQPMTRKKREGSGRLQRKAYPRAGWSGLLPLPRFRRSRPRGNRPEEAAPLVPAGARHWRALAMGAAGLAVLLLIPTPLRAAPSFYGTTGLFVTPTAQVAPRGTWSAGANYLNREFRNGAASFASGTVTHSLTVTLLPRLEVAALLTNWEGKMESSA